MRGLYLLVLDALSSTGSHTYELLWHLAPGLSVEIGRGGAVDASGAQDSSLRVQVVGSHELESSVAEGETDPIQGWHSPLYGIRQPAPSLIWKTTAAGPVHLATLVRSVSRGTSATPILSFECRSEQEPGMIILTVTGLGFNDRIGLPDPDQLSLGYAREDLLWLERDGQRIPLYDTP